MFPKLSNIFLSIYFITIFIFFIIFYICLPRLQASHKKIPTAYYLLFYIISSLVINFGFGIKPILSILIHLSMLISSNFIGVRLRVAGLTGQICSGKSTVAKYLTDKYKAYVIDIDELNRKVLDNDVVKTKIRKIFGDDVYDDKNQLDKLKMRRIIFADQEKKKMLEGITHKRVFRLLIKTILIQKLLYSTKYVFIENAILLRFKLLKFICFPIISVISNNKADLIKRIINRDNCDRATAEKILENQMNLEEFISQSEYVVFNDEGKHRLEQEVDKIMKVIS